MAFIVIAVGVCKITVFLLIRADNPSRIFTPDSASYLDTAQALLKTGRFAVSPERPEIPQIIRTPGYPFFIASIFAGFGEHYAPLIITQILLSLGTILITYRMVTLLWGTRIALVSAFLLALDLPSFISSHQILTETLFTFVLSMTMATGIYVLKQPQHVGLGTFLYSVLLALTTLIRPITYYTIVLVLAVFTIVWRTYFTWEWRKIARLVATLSIPWLTLVGGWQLRNYLTAGVSEFGAIQGVNLLFYRGAAIIAQRDGISFEEAQQRLGYGHYPELHPETKGWSVAQLSQRWKQEGMTLIRMYPWLFVKTQIWGAAKMMLGPGENTLLDYLGNAPEKTGPGRDFLELPLSDYIRKWMLGKTGLFALFCFSEVYLLLFYSGVIFSVASLIRPYTTLWRVHIFIWGFSIALILISSGPEAYSRFRIPIMPLLSVYAGHGLCQMTAALKRRECQECKNEFLHS